MHRSRTIWSAGAAALSLAAAVTAGCARTPALASYTFQCADGYVVHATFIHDSLRLQLPDTTLLMSHLVSADGGRYGADSLIFWEKGTTAFMQHGDSIIHRNCVRRG